MEQVTLARVVEDGVRAMIGSALAEVTQTPVRAKLVQRTPEVYRADVLRLASYSLKAPVEELRMDRVLTDDEQATLQELIRLRADGTPTGYLTGTVPFAGIVVQVGPGVFLPRAESELVVEHVLRIIEGQRAPVIVDLCTGTGAVGLALAHARPDAVVHSVDIDPEAVGYARRNSALQGAAGGTEIAVYTGDAGDPAMLAELDGRADVVLGFPPFMREGDQPWLVSEFADYQPAVAIYSGPDGLDVTRAVLSAAVRLLRPGGTCVIEHGPLHADAVPLMMADGGRFTGVEAHTDSIGWGHYTLGVRTDLG
jgi:release factor glutamine methyltransferase